MSILSLCLCDQRVRSVVLRSVRPILFLSVSATENKL